jgi:hypothetical protein
VYHASSHAICRDIPADNAVMGYLTITARQPDARQDAQGFVVFA